MRGVVLLGERTRFQNLLEGMHELVARVKAGIGGVSQNGCLLALTVDGKRGRETLLFMLSLTPPIVVQARDPALVITTTDSLFGGILLP